MDDLNRDDLPTSLRILAQAIGLPATRDLVERFGGTRIYIPKERPPRQELVEAVGWEAVHRLRYYLGGELIYVPRAISNADRDGRLCADRAAGHPIRQIAHRYGMSEQGVRNILRRGEMKKRKN